MPLSAMLTMVNFILSSGIYLGLGVSVAMGLSQSSFLGVWVSLELNMLLFVALLSFSKSGLEVVSMKYFIVQSIGSTLFLSSVGMATFMGVSEALMSLMSLALFLKLGVAPFHGWFISVMSDIRWDFFFLASTVQKVLPLYLISVLSSGLLALVVVLSSLVSVLGSLNQLLIKKLLAYSSVFSSAWMLTCEENFLVLVQYLSVYGVSLGLIISIVVYDLHTKVGEITLMSSESINVIFLVSFLSLGGTPPFLGFYAKVLVIQEMMNHQQVLLAVSLVASSVFLLYIYMRFFFSLLTHVNYTSNLYNANRGVSMALILVILSLVVVIGLLRMGVQARKVLNFQGLSSIKMRKYKKASTKHDQNAMSNSL